MSTAAPAYSILATISRVVEKEIRAAGLGLALGTITDARTPLVRLQGFDGSIEALLPDWFDLAPLVRGDLVVLGQLAGGEWMILNRLSSGSVSGIDLQIDPSQLTTPVVQAGSPFTDDGDEIPARIQSSQSDPIVFTAGHATPVTWTFTDAYSAPPVVAALLISTDLDAGILSVWVSAVGETSAVVQVRNDDTDSVTASIMALALGAV